MFHALGTVYREEGFRALYKGWLPSVIGVVSFLHVQSRASLPPTILSKDLGDLICHLEKRLSMRKLPTFFFSLYTVFIKENTVWDNKSSNVI